MPDNILLSSLTLEVALYPEKLNEYRRGMQIFHNRLVELHLNVYILEKLFDCPLHLFLGPDLYFFRQVILNCFHASVLMVTSLTTDEGDDIYTLLNLRDRLSAEYLKPEYRSVFRATLGAIRFRQKTRNLLSKARQLRNQEIAHLLDRDTIVSDAEIEHLPFSLEELQTLRNTLKELFCALSFNATYSMFPAGYSDDPLTNGGLSTDIERVLSMIADQSSILYLPENDPVHWQQRRGRLSPEQLRKFNLYRRKFGLSEE